MEERGGKKKGDGMRGVERRGKQRGEDRMRVAKSWGAEERGGKEKRREQNRWMGKKGGKWRGKVNTKA